MRTDAGNKERPVGSDNRLRWMTAASLATFLLLCIALTAYFLYAGSSRTSPVPGRMARPVPAEEPAQVTEGRKEATETPRHHQNKWITYHDAPVRVTPNVLLCATNGRGPAVSEKLSAALDAYCTHAIYTGPLAIARKQPSGKLYVQVKDKAGYRVFSGLSKTFERYLSFRWDAASWNEGDVLQALVSYLRFFKLRGIELVMSSHLQKTKFLRFCQSFVYKMKNNASLIIKVERTVDLTKKLFERLASLPMYLVLETQVVQMSGMQTRRFPNPYQPFAGSHQKDVYMRYRLWKVHPWRRRLHLDNVCFTLSMAVIKEQKGAVRNTMLGYNYTSLKEPCQQTGLQKGIDWKALSRFRENRTVYYAYDNKQTLTNKIWRLAHEFPRYCVAVYDVEMDDFEDVCPKKSVPLLRVVQKLVTATKKTRQD